jgi:hypothetical protein
MANYDVSTVTINTDGFSADIKFLAMAAGGTYSFGLGTGNDPANLKIVFTVTKPGYTNAGAETTHVRTIYGVPTIQPSVGAFRKIYPDDETPNETTSGSDVIIRIALSDYIMDLDTATVSIAAGFYTQGGNPSNATTDHAVTNDSDITYAMNKIKGDFAYPYQKYVARGNFLVEFCAFHSSGIACVIFNIADEHSHNVSYTVTSMTTSTLPDYNKVLVFAQTVNVSTLTTTDLLTVKAVAYPNDGNSTNILDTNDAVYSFPTTHYTNCMVRLYKSGEYGYTVVDPVNGNDTTGTVYSSQGAAEAGSACLSIAGALDKLQTYHNSNYSRNNAGGGIILCTEGTINNNSTNGGTLTEWVTVTRISTATKNNVIVVPAIDDALNPAYIRFYDVKLQSTSNDWKQGAGKYWCMESCTLNTTSYSGTLSLYTCDYAVALFCTGTYSGAFYEYSTTTCRWHIIRGNNISTTYNNACRGGIVIGNNGITFIERSAAQHIDMEGSVFAFNTYYGPLESGIILIGEANLNAFTQGVAIVQNVIERHGSKTAPLVKIGAAASNMEVSGVLIWYNTFVGGRSNLAYNGLAGGTPPYPRKCWSIKNNFFAEQYQEGDWFVENAGYTGGLAVGYNVGSSSNHIRTAEPDRSMGEFPTGLYGIYGSAVTPLEAEFVDDLSADGGDTGGGDYHLTASSPGATIVPTPLLPYDIGGATRHSAGATGAWEYTTSSGLSITIVMAHNRRMM